MNQKLPKPNTHKAAEAHLPTRGIRPRFKIKTPFPEMEIEEKLRTSLKKGNVLIVGRVNSGYATFYLPFEEQHYWSPQLNLTFENEEDSCLIRGMYGPRPAVWTMFIFFYSLIAFAILFISIIGFSNYSLDKSAMILWLVPVLMLIFLSLWLVAYFGQKLGHEQMVILHEFIEDSLGVEIIN